MQANAEKPNRENLTLAERVGEVAIIASLLFLFGFFWLHQSTNTGFFTAGFGTLARVCLYGPIVIALVAPAVRAVTGRRNPARPSEAVANTSLGLGTLWLLISFPLDFTHLGDVLPTSIRFLLGWVTDGLGRILMILQVILMPISVAVNIGWYFTIRKRKAAEPTRPKMP